MLPSTFAVSIEDAVLTSVNSLYVQNSCKLSTYNEYGLHVYVISIEIFKENCKRDQNVIHVFPLDVTAN